MPRFAQPICLGLLLTAAATSLSAQYSGPYRGGGGTHWGSASRATSNLLLNRAIQRQGNRLRQGLTGSRRAAPAPRPTVRGKASSAPGKAARPSAPAVTVGSTRFTPVAPSIVPQELALAAGNTPERQREMRRYFENCLTIYEEDRRQKGLPVKDVALAVSYFIGASYNVYNGGSSFSTTGGKALQAQVRQALTEDGEFARLPNAEKQRMYETMAVMGVFVLHSAGLADENGSKALKAMARDVAKDNLERLLHTPVSRVKITDAGITF